MTQRNCDNNIFGYGYDFWIFSVGAKIAKIPDICKLHYDAEPYTGERSFAFPICDSNGVWFNFVSDNDECGGTVFVKRSEKKVDTYFTPPWMTSDEINDANYIKIESSFKEPMISAINAALELSPVRKVYLILRCQCKGRKNVIGMLTFEQIRKLIENDELIANVAYIIYDRADCLCDIITVK